jgi:hypothetical protein
MFQVVAMRGEICGQCFEQRRVHTRIGTTEIIHRMNQTPSKK